MADVLHCNVAVIGAGTAGLAAERAARSSGATTLLIDPKYAGTMCATVGCMPSKLLIAAAHAAHAANYTEMFGIEVDGIRIDGAAVMQRVREERDRFARLTREGIEDIPEAVRLTGRARFAGATTLILDDGRKIEARTVVIATGSTPFVPAEFAGLGSRILTNQTIFELEDLPDRLALVGAGAIGLELSQAMARLGVAVTLFDNGHRLGAIRCDKVHSALREIVAKDVELKMGTTLDAKANDNSVTLEWSGDTTGEADFDYVLVTTGRPPNLDTLDLGQTGLELGDDGVPLHDRETMRCGDSPVFLAGDVADEGPLLGTKNLGAYVLD